jgi:peptide/nickel transport system ATP-binding protein
LLGLLEPTSGRILLGGQDVTHLDGRARRAYWQRVQGVFQDPFASFNQFFTVRRVLEGACRLLQPQPSPPERAERI